jgi:hypothetical protein
MTVISLAEAAAAAGTKAPALARWFDRHPDKLALSVKREPGKGHRRGCTHGDVAIIALACALVRMRFDVPFAWAFARNAVKTRWPDLFDFKGPPEYFKFKGEPLIALAFQPGLEGVGRWAWYEHGFAIPQLREGAGGCPTGVLIINAVNIITQAFARLKKRTKNKNKK